MADTVDIRGEPFTGISKLDINNIDKDQSRLVSLECKIFAKRNRGTER
jgi:hypothetical protein